MSQTTREINRVTGTVIGISLKLILLALIFILLYEGVTRGYSFGHEIFDPTAVAEVTGEEREIQVVMEEGISPKEAGQLLEKQGLIQNAYVFLIESLLYEYEIQPGSYTLNTAQTSMDILKILDEGPKTEESGT